ncbi:hypothetical protein D8I35_10105 [Corticibacter populi]|uniref:Uncharacterized protein n=1 Tax=Corticibacter populi TaxID=1550736 RepID=A0A3M6QUY8_9BURK|nr:hypothetical protein [Corticibacter populi]RMX06835.1 hypothetical protein D8I35_10105 [Corticibacter populi]RZS31573.1 hypothetical protein EV687_2233 [Corticibacter populi]
MNLQHWISQARDHWKEFQPTRYKQLQESGRLGQALKDAAEQTHREMTQLEEAGFANHEAWEMVRELYLFPPEERKQPDAMMPTTASQLSAMLRSLREAE